MPAGSRALRRAQRDPGCGDRARSPAETSSAVMPRAAGWSSARSSPSGTTRRPPGFPIGRDHMTGHPPRKIRCEEQDDVGVVGRLPDAPDRHPDRPALPLIGRDPVLVVDLRGLRDVGCDRVHPHAPTRDVEREATREVDDGGPARRTGSGGYPRMPSTDDTLMIEPLPRSSIDGRNSRVHVSTCAKFTACSASQCAGSLFSNDCAPM